MTISYTTEGKLALLDSNSENWGAVFNGILEQLDEGWELNFTAEEIIAQYDVVYISDVNKVSKADANDPAKRPAVGIALSAAAIGVEVQVLVFGWLDYNDTAHGGALGATNGDTIYLSTTTGYLTITPDTDYPQVLGIAKSDTAANITRIFLSPVLHVHQLVDKTNSPTFDDLTLTGKLVAGTFAAPIDVTVAREYGVEIHYSGNNYGVTGIRSRASLITTDTTASAQGALLQAANNDGIDAGVLNGALIEAIGKSSASAATISMMRGCLVNTEWDAFDTVTDLRILHVRTHTRNNAAAGYFSNSGYGVYLENEAVGGNGQALTAGLYFKETNISGGNYGFVLGIDFTGGTFETAELKLKSGALLKTDATFGVMLEHTSSLLTLKNTTAGDGDGDRLSKLSAIGKQSGGELSILGSIAFSHDGAADDEKGKIILSTNDGNDGNTPTAALTIDSSQSVSYSKFDQWSVTSGITAVNPGVQGDGPLTTAVNEISTVANANDAVTLPTAALGRHVVVINNGANTLEIWPASGDDAGAGVDTAVTLAAGSNVHFVAYNATNWEVL